MTKSAKAAPDKGAAARSEITDEPKTIDFRGVKLTLPPALPGTLYFDLADLGEDSGDIGVQVRLLSSFVGPDQVRVVRAKIAEDQISFDDVDEVLIGLFESILGVYGLGLGEPSASADS